MTNINNLYTPEEVEAIKAGISTGDKVLTNTPKGVVSYKPALNIINVDEAPSGPSQWAGEAPRVSGGTKVSKPRVRGQEAAGVVTRVNMDANNSNHAEQIRQLEVETAKRDAEQQELRSFMDPAKLMAEINYLNRTVKRLEKSLKALQKESSHE